MGDGRYIEIPGIKTHQLPPLLVSGITEEAGDGMDLTSAIVEAAEMLAATDADEQVLERRKYDLALQLAGQYRELLSHWRWGDSILEWVRQCEITFEADATLCALLQPDVWPHASRSSFVTLLREKHFQTPVVVEHAVGLRLTFRQPPPMACISDQFLFYLNATVADSAYQAWSDLNRGGMALLPPHRFHFELVKMDN